MNKDGESEFLEITLTRAIHGLPAENDNISEDIKHSQILNE